MIILGLDPGLGTTGWGIIRAEGNRLAHLANGQFKTDASEPLPQRLSHLASQLEALLVDHAPQAAAVEEVFVNNNPQSTIKLGQARGVALMVAARAGLEVGEYAARLVKKAVVGNGNAEKAQVHAMVSRLLRRAGADHRLLDQPGGIFADLQARAGGDHQCNTAGLAELERRLRVLVDEHFLDGGGLRGMIHEQRFQL